jgi:CheY-like chemotaxis protein
MDDSFPRQPREPALGGGARSWAARIVPTLRLCRPQRIANARRLSFRRDSTRMEPFKVWTVALPLQLGTTTSKNRTSEITAFAGTEELECAHASWYALRIPSPQPAWASCGKTCHLNKKILFVDDDPSALELYRKILQGEFEIATGVSGEDGLLALRNGGPYATVIADLLMPGMDGV